jgi:uncharacterized protein YkwD
MVKGDLAAARRLAAAVVLALAVAPSALGATPLERDVLNDINALRAQHHLAALTVSAQLTSAARTHSVSMAQNGYFKHESADGSSFWLRVRSFYRASSWRYWAVGENLLWSSPRIDAPRALRLWLGSPEHRKNLLNPAWREIGISAVYAHRAPGVFGDRDVTILTTDFGVRR